MLARRIVPALGAGFAAHSLHARLRSSARGLAFADDGLVEASRTGSRTRAERGFSSWTASEPPDAFHKYDVDRSNIGRALAPGIATARYRPDQTEVVRVVLTGGPCAGKSSALTHLVENATAAGYDVYRMPEIASVLLNSGCSFPNPGANNFDEQLFVFQQQIACLQLQAERSFLKIAGNTGRPSIVIFDRGLLDSKAYLPDQNTWDTLLQSVEASAPDMSVDRQYMTEEYILGRYDMVIHLVTAADGAEEHYKSGDTTDDSGNAVQRSESLEQAVAVDKKLQQVWAVHKRHVIIRNGPKGFSEKLERCTHAIIEVAGEIQPQPFHKRIKKLQDENELLRKQLKEFKTKTAS